MSRFSLARKLTRHTSVAISGHGFNQMCFFFAGIAIARYLGKEAFGVYSFAMFFSYVFTALFGGGLPIILIREVARDREKAGLFLGNVILIRLALTVLTLMLLPCTMFLMDLSPLKAKAVYIAVLADLTQLYGMIAVAVFRAFEEMIYEGALRIVQGLVFLALVLAAIFLEASLLIIISALLVANAMSILFGYYLVIKRFVRPENPLTPSIWKFLIKEAAPVAVSSFLIVSYSRIGTIALERFQDSSEVGLFNTAFSLMYNLNIVPWVLTGTILPIFSRHAVSKKDELPSVYASALKFMLICGLPLVVGGMLLARPVVVTVFGAEYAEASVALQVIIWSLPFFFASLVTKTALEAINRQGQWTIALMIGVFANLVLNVALVPKTGILGASLALVLADILIFGVAFYCLSRELSLPFDIIVVSTLKCLICSATMGAVIHYFKNQNVLILVFLGGIVYFSSLLLLRVFDRDEMALMKEAIGLGQRVYWFPGSKKT